MSQVNGLNTLGRSAVGVTRGRVMLVIYQIMYRMQMYHIGTVHALLKLINYVIITVLPFTMEADVTVTSSWVTGAAMFLHNSNLILHLSPFSQVGV